ncbi:phage antirepressor protein [Mycobacterium marinum M]|uniref:Phage antirepressor protein n=1 Tax=Mycobacterium marinum (strain ATCC BAA-535 / M) TaxID=216594 RepID=B2HPJ9_MYCMM|nr:BRO family protein [Mycobacterium marinum]ACC42351.1 phage antirepressor protein [Mycobacterium marinum M]
MSADEYRTCANCGDQVDVGLSARDWCAGCEDTAYELAYPEVNAAPESGPGAIEVFAYKHTRIRTIVVDGRRWAVAADICGFLELSNPSMALKRIDDADKRILHRSEALNSIEGFWESFAAKVHSVGLVSEDGATDLVLDSRKPDARRFRRFLTHTVWPSIRDTGSYTTAPALPQTREERLALAVIDAQQMITEKDEQLAALTGEKKCLEAAIERDAPLVAKAEAHTGSDSAIHRQAFAREVQHWGQKQGVDIKHSEVMRFLSHIGLFIRGDRTDTGHATADAQRRGLAFTDKGTAKNGHAWATGKLTAAGQDYAWKRITRYIGENGHLRLPRELRCGDPA